MLPGKKIPGGPVRGERTAVAAEGSGGGGDGFFAGGRIFLPPKGEPSLFPAAAVDISVWKTVWIMCKTQFLRGVAAVSTDYVPGGARSLFFKFHRFLSKVPAAGPVSGAGDRENLG